MLILVADDEEDIRVLMQLLLEVHGHEVTTAANGAEAVEKARQRRPDLVLMDLRMPVMDGFTAARILCEAPETRGVPIIAVSAYVSDKEWCQRALDAGCAKCIGKPVNIAELEAELARANTLSLASPGGPDDRGTNASSV